MPKTCLAVRHVAFEDLGTFAAVLTAAGYEIRYAAAGLEDLARLDPQAPDLLAVLGGPIGAYEEDRYPFVVDEIRLLEARLAAGKPTLGVCLGAQMLARAAGARVYPGPRKEIGFAPLDLTAEGRASPLRHLEGAAVLHWHGDTFDLPQGAIRLASTEVTPNQAFSLGKNALALQFHAEADAARIESWLIGHASELAATKIAPGELRRAAAEHGARLKAAGRALIDEWLKGLA